MPVSNKKIIIIVFLILILFAGIIALTQETDDELPDIDYEEIDFLTDLELDQDINEWKKPSRWFRSNSGGMALEEVQSRFSALRSQYALSINYVSKNELPEYLLSYYIERYFVEVRILYKDGEQLRTQWILRDEKGITRLNAVFIEPDFEDKEENVFEEEEIAELFTDEEPEILAQTIDKESEILAQPVVEEAEDLAQMTDEQQEEETAIKDIKHRRGFIEIFNEDFFLTSEYKFFEDGKIEKTEYALKDKLLINATYLISENGDDYKISHIDYYRYNRSLSLRNIERIFQKDGILDDPILAAFPRRIMDTAKEGVSISERFNLYPEFFGDILTYIGSKMIFDIDDKGRVLGQTLYDDENNVIWIIKNTWQNNRIAVTSKTEGETVLTAEYAYNSEGERILERNIKNGILERVVSTKGDTEIEELFMNNVVVVRAIWENGVKISETMVRN